MENSEQPMRTLIALSKGSGENQAYEYNHLDMLISGTGGQGGCQYATGVVARRGILALYRGPAWQVAQHGGLLHRPPLFCRPNFHSRRFRGSGGFANARLRRCVASGES